MTEEEAKTKWCPMVKYDLGRSVNRDACYDNAGTHCVGSACMMWRWDAITPEEKRQLRVYGDSTGPLLAIPGFCGLAGKQFE